jgi:hypothetical protein
MAKMKIPFQLTCTFTSRKLIRENPDMVLRLIKAMADPVHLLSLDAWAAVSDSWR